MAENINSLVRLAETYFVCQFFAWIVKLPGYILNFFQALDALTLPLIYTKTGSRNCRIAENGFYFLPAYV